MNQESRIVEINRYEKGMDAPGTGGLEGKVITGIFELAGQRFMALDGGPIFTFTDFALKRLTARHRIGKDRRAGEESGEPSTDLAT